MDRDIIFGIILCSIMIFPNIVIQFDSYVYNYFCKKSKKEDENSNNLNKNLINN
jgi:hypothetical protein